MWRKIWDNSQHIFKLSSQSNVSVEWVRTQLYSYTKKMNKIHGDWEREKKLYMLLQDWEELKVSTGALASKTQESQCNMIQEQFGYKINMEIYMVARGDRKCYWHIHQLFVIWKSVPSFRCPVAVGQSQQRMFGPRICYRSDGSKIQSNGTAMMNKIELCN